ncbi:MAG: magnesium chelatase ATPase subunit I, partial [Pseudomonadota bacterium]
LDRFGLSVEVRTPTDLETRVDVIKARDAFDRNPEAFLARAEDAEGDIRRQIISAKEKLETIATPDAAIERAAELCLAMGTDGLRGELTLIRAGRAYACLQGDDAVGDAHLRAVAPSALRHRLRRDPLDDAGSTVRVERGIAEVFGA